MTTQHDERAELIRKLNFAADNNLMLPSAYAEAFRKAAALLAADAQAGGEAVALHEKVKWGAQTYGPLLRAAIDLLAAVDARHEETGTLKYTIPYGAVNALRDAINTHPQPQAVAQGCAGCGKTSTSDSMWALYCLDCTQKHGIGAMPWIELVHELCPEGIEDLCDECGGEDSKCHAGCTYRKARAMLSASPAAPAAAQDIDWLPHDDRLRFVQRVLESDAPKADRNSAAKMVRDMRLSIRPAAAQVAQPLTEEQMYKVEEQARIKCARANSGPGGQTVSYWDSLTPWLIREVEAAHGFGKDTS